MLCFVPINNVLLNIDKNYMFVSCFRTLAVILDSDFGKLCFILINSVFVLCVWIFLRTLAVILVLDFGKLCFILINSILLNRSYAFSSCYRTLAVILVLDFRMPCFVPNK